MDFTGFVLFIWLLGFAITSGMVYEIIHDLILEARWHSWVLLLIIILITWPIIVGGMIVVRKDR